MHTAQHTHLPRHVPTRWFDHALLAAIVLLMGAAVVPLAWRMYQADWAVASTRPLLSQWSENRKPLDDTQWQMARMKYERALAHSPDSPALHDELAALFILAARTNEPQSDLRLALYEQAATHQVSALALRPAHSWTWAGLAESMRELQPDGEDGWQAWRTAAQYGPQELLVKATLYHLGREAQSPPPDVQAWMAATQATASSQLRQLLNLDAPSAQAQPADALYLKLELSLNTGE